MIDAIYDECGIVAAADLGAEHAEAGLPANDTGSAASLVPGLLLDIQNRGQLAAGITSYNGDRRDLLKTFKELGGVNKVFRLGDKTAARQLMADHAGSVAIGHTRYATCGRDDVNYAQPLTRPHGKTFKWFSFCFNGNVANHKQLLDHLADDLGFHLVRPDSDTELFLHYLSFLQRGDKQTPWQDVFAQLAEIVDGAWSMALVGATGELVVARDPTGLKPLCWGRLGRFVLAASESIALQNLGVQEIHDLAPGTMLYVRGEAVRVQGFAPAAPAHCFFEWVYFANVASVIDGCSV